MDHRVVMRTRLGDKTAMTDYIAILEARERMIADVERLPPATNARLLRRCPCRAADRAAGPGRRAVLRDERQDIAQHAIGNFLDWCGVSIPCGTGEAGMPVGLSAVRPAEYRRTPARRGACC